MRYDYPLCIRSWRASGRSSSVQEKPCIQGSSRIPFIISGGGAAQGRAGRVSRELVELRDVMPTVLEAAGVAVPDSVEGISLWDMVQTENGFVDREYLHGEHALGAASSHWIVTRLEKYIWYSQTGEEQYFPYWYG